MSGEDRYWLGHRARLREKARNVGIEKLRPYEIVELMLYPADPRSDMAQLARALMDRFGSIRALLSAPREALMSVEGMYRRAADWILRTGEMMRCFQEAEQTVYYRISHVKDLMGYIEVNRWQVTAPQTWMLYADQSERLMMCSVLCESLGWADPAVAMDILRESMALQARRAFLVCFTGSEPPALEAHEASFLGQLAVTLHAAGVELMDCLLVSDTASCSLNRSGQMDNVRKISGNPWLHERYVKEDAPCAESPDL